MLNTPVLFLIFNRPDSTRLVFEAIRKAKPAHLFIAADGPRIGKVEDIDKCRQAREVVNSIDWNCEVKTLFRENNLGCKLAVSSAINWFFEHVEHGIILEDDTLPNQSFFTFCEELLNYYKDDKRVMHIGGINFQRNRKQINTSYYFSNYNHIWGWATWRRAWRLYDSELGELDKFISEERIKNVTTIPSEIKYWIKVFKDVKEGKVNTWDYQWTFSIWNNFGLSVLPNINLIENIGFGEESTHTSTKPDIYDTTLIGNIDKIIHAKSVIIDKQADIYTYKNMFNPPTSIPNRIRNFTYKYYPRLSKFIQNIKK